MKGISTTLMYIVVGVSIVIFLFVIFSIFLGGYIDIHLALREEDFTKKTIILNEAILSNSKLLENLGENKKYLFKALFNKSKLKGIQSKISFDFPFKREVGDIAYPNLFFIFNVYDLEEKVYYGPFILFDENDKYAKSEEYKCMFRFLKDNPEKLNSFLGIKEGIKKCFGLDDEEIWGGYRSYVFHLKLPCMITDRKVYHQCFINSLSFDYSYYLEVKQPRVPRRYYR